jgi:hypothetical protein
VPFDELVDLVRRLRMEANTQLAITGGVCELLGWNDSAHLHAATAIRAALAIARAAEAED